MPIQRKKKHATQVSLVVSTVFHGLVLAALGFFAAREGYLGKQLRTIAVTMAPKEKPPEPEKPKVPEKPPEPPPEVERPPETPTPSVQPPPTSLPAAANTAPPPVAPAGAAPPPVGLPSFSFSDGAKAVVTTSDPIQLYKSFVEFSFRSKWIRPEGIDDKSFVAEVEVEVSPTGKVLGSTWKRGSGGTQWDESVRRAVNQTTSLSRPPPKGFPGTFLVRFDVVEEVDANSLSVP